MVSVLIGFRKEPYRRVARRQAGFAKAKLGYITFTTTLQSDESDMEDDGIPIEQAVGGLTQFSEHLR